MRIQAHENTHEQLLLLLLALLKHETKAQHLFRYLCFSFIYYDRPLGDFSVFHWDYK